FVFVTDGTTTATSTTIATYDAFATTQAGGATYNGSTVTWQAIGSTSAVHAIDHIGQTSDAVYLSDGTKVTTTTTSSGLWSGTLLHAINEDLSGTLINAFVWTGTDDTGIGFPTAELGGVSGLANTGSSSAKNPVWVNGVARQSSQLLPIFA